MRSWCLALTASLAALGGPAAARDLPQAPARTAGDDVLAVLLGGARSPFHELVTTGWAEVPRELPAPWV